MHNAIIVYQVNFQLLLRGKTPILRRGQAYFYPPHLILTFAYKSQGGTGPPLVMPRGGGARGLLPRLLCVRA